MSRSWLRLAGLACVAVSLPAEAPPNFVVILSDDQSWVGGSVQMDPQDPRSRSDYFRTPSLERLAQRGITFTDGYAPAPFCCPTRRSLQIGQTPARHIYQRNQAAWPGSYRHQLNIPRLLKEADSRYRAAHFGKWDHRFDRPAPEDMGYDLSDGDTGNGTGGGKGSGGPAAAADPKLIGHITDRACRFLEAHSASGAPFYLQISHYAVHLDIFYRQPTFDLVKLWEPGRKHSMPEFAAMTADMDASVGRVLDKLEALELADTTYVFFLSDNGGRATIPSAGEPPMPRNHPLRGAKGSMYEGGIRVPFLVTGPGIAAGRVSRTPVTGLDILPTLADLSGYDGQLPESIDGGSLAPLFAGAGHVERPRDFLIFHQAVARKAQTALRLDNWKVVKTWATDKVELFDLARDVGETRNIANDNPRQTERLHAFLTEYLLEVGAETRQTE